MGKRGKENVLGRAVGRLAKRLGRVVWIIWPPPEWDPECLLCAGVPSFAPSPPSPSAMLMAEAEKIRT